MHLEYVTGYTNLQTQKKTSDCVVLKCQIEKNGQISQKGKSHGVITRSGKKKAIYYTLLLATECQANDELVTLSQNEIARTQMSFEGPFEIHLTIPFKTTPTVMILITEDKQYRSSTECNFII